VKSFLPSNRQPPKPSEGELKKKKEEELRAKELKELEIKRKKEEEIRRKAEENKRCVVCLQFLIFFFKFSVIYQASLLQRCCSDIGIILQ